MGNLLLVIVIEISSLYNKAAIGLFIQMFFAREFAVHLIGSGADTHIEMGRLMM